ncbi:MAG: lipopolysaccharide biosynthesis protein [Acidimicrobiales bacterium]
MTSLDAPSDAPPPAGFEPPGGRPARSTAGNLVWSVSGEAIRLAGSFGAFLLLVRVFPPAELGLLIAATGLFTMLVPFAGLGGGWLVLRRVASEGWPVADALKVANGMTLVGSAALGLLAVAARPVIMPQMPWLWFIGVGVSEMLVLGLVETAVFAAQATERLVAKAAAWAVYGLARAGAAAVIVVTVDDPGLGLWIAVTIGIGLGVLVVAQLLTLGRVVGASRPRWSTVTAGVPYSLGFGAERLLAASDNVLLVRLGYEADAGLHAAARRMLTVSIAPVLAALQAVNARLWRAGGRHPNGAAEAGRLAVRLSAFGSVYGLVAAAAWITLGDTVAALLGSSYAEAAAIIPWLSVVPLLLVLEVFAAGALTSSGHHVHRVALTLLVGMVNIGLNLAWIPGLGWRGAVYASLISSLLYVVLLWVTLGVVIRPKHGGGTRS